jgi:hypothetical protein
MKLASLCHTEIARELATLRAAVSSATEFELGRSPNKSFRVEVVDELIAKFQKQHKKR